MTISQNILNQFVQLNKGPKEKKETIVYGDVFIISGKYFVKMDGANSYTPFTPTSEVNNGDRVAVTIKDHTAISYGNLSNPSINGNSSVITDITNNITIDTSLIDATNQASINQLENSVGNFTPQKVTDDITENIITNIHNQDQRIKRLENKTSEDSILRVGNFAFSPQTDGSLSVLKIVGSVITNDVPTDMDIYKLETLTIEQLEALTILQLERGYK